MKFAFARNTAPPSPSLPGATFWCLVAVVPIALGAYTRPITACFPRALGRIAGGLGDEGVGGDCGVR